tara:strand:+ start:2300 stop:3487 length:1188 start_codon:yes stop_codon:yes gene_type:complete
MSDGLKINRAVKVGFVINFTHDKWLGGYNIILNLIKSLNFLKNKKIEPVLIVNTKFKKKFINQAGKIKFIKSDFFNNENLFNRILNKISIFFLGRSNKYENFFKKNGISILSHTLLPLGKNSSIKSFPWIPDFQYLHYPENFSFKNRIMKTINVIFCSIHSTNIILSSNDVKKDIKKISYKAFERSKINRFVFEVPEKKNILNIKNLRNKYKIPSKFFYLPNQYWVHKNHFLVLKALKKIIIKNKSIIIISTGYTDDHRSKGYFNEVLSFIKENNLQSNYRHLGVLPYADVMSLMFYCVAVLNPSKFEGWSSSVEQAKSMGKKIILSNIGVHKEQNPLRGIYFNANNFKELSSILIQTWKNYDEKKEKKFINNAYKLQKEMLIEYAKQYQKIILK